MWGKKRDNESESTGNNSNKKNEEFVPTKEQIDNNLARLSDQFGQFIPSQEQINSNMERLKGEFLEARIEKAIKEYRASSDEKGAKNDKKPRI